LKIARNKHQKIEQNFDNVLGSGVQKDIKSIQLERKKTNREIAELQQALADNGIAQTEDLTDENCIVS
jgi:hypothetical protein